MSRHMTKERRIVLGILNAMGLDISEVTREEYNHYIIAAGLGLRDGYPDDVLEIFHKQDQEIWNGD